MYMVMGERKMNMEKMKKRVTVIMSAYNHQEYVEEAIQSVLNQTYRDFKFIVADDASTDNTANIITKYKDLIDEIHLFEENSGHGRTRELISYSDTEYIAEINSDDSWEQDKLKKQVAYMDKHPECGACFTWCNEIDENGEKTDIQIFQVDNRSKEEWMFYFWKNGNCLANPSILIRRELYVKLCSKNIGVYRQLPDFYMWLQLIQKWEIHIIKKNLTTFRHHKKNENVSAFTVVNSIRTNMENEYIWYRMMKKMDYDYFKRAFQNVLMNPDAWNEKELLCEKFFVLCISPVMATQSAAVLYYYDVFENLENYKVLCEKYGYCNKIFFQQEMLMGKGKYQLNLLQESSSKEK